MFYQTNCTQFAERAEKCHFLSLVTSTFDLDIQTRPRAKHIFRVNLAQIRSAFRKILHTQTKKTD